jgi:hypothetical protein
VLTEAAYLDIAERLERFTLGDRNVYRDPVTLIGDMMNLMSDWREWQRKLADCEQQRG